MFYSDEIFEETKLLKRGDILLPEFSKCLAEWIKDRYTVNVLNISYDFLEPEKRPRLGVIVETFEEKDKFTNSSNCLGGYIEQYQKEIAKEFYRLIARFDVIEASFVNALFHKMALVDKGILKKNVFVYFTHFKQAAKEYAINRTPNGEITKFIKVYEKAPIWKIHYSTGLKVFLFKDSQIKKFKTLPVIEEMRREYFNIIKPNDEFNYFENIESVWVSFDSKENLDDNYEGSFFHYYR